MHLCDRLLRNALVLNTAGECVAGQSIAIKSGRILWCGADAELPESYLMDATYLEDCKGRLLTPGFIDCHTHLVYAGDRAAEFRQRMQGMRYADIARAGGGILSTVRQTAEASEEALLLQSLPRILAMRDAGVTTVEIKSGYGLDLANELKMLRVARQLGEISKVHVKTTFLGAHALPGAYAGNSQAYVDLLCREMLPAVAESGLADAVDVFCEHIGFSLTQTEQIFRAAQDFSLPVKCHAEQLSNMGATALAARYGALSSDHLEYLDAKAAAAMAAAGTIAVLLPGAYYFLGESKAPPVSVLRESGTGMAIATDCNPGSSPTTSLLLMMSMACRFFGMTVEEAFSGVTFQAAKALGIEKERGIIAAGMIADLVRWSVYDNTALCYHFGYPQPCEIMIAGEWVVSQEESVLD